MTPGAALQETHIVMEFCDGGSLEEALGRGVFHPTASGGAQEPDLAAVCATLLDIAAAMEYLHQHARVILQGPQAQERAADVLPGGGHFPQHVIAAEQQLECCSPRQCALPSPGILPWWHAVQSMLA